MYTFKQYIIENAAASDPSKWSETKHEFSHMRKLEYAHKHDIDGNHVHVVLSVNHDNSYEASFAVNNKMSRLKNSKSNLKIINHVGHVIKHFQQHIVPGAEVVFHASDNDSDVAARKRKLYSAMLKRNKVKFDVPDANAYQQAKDGGVPMHFRIKG